MYMSAWSPGFDVWSCKSKERNGRLVPAVDEQSAAKFNKMFQVMHDTKKLSESSRTLKYFEKMPEHVLRIP